MSGHTPGPWRVFTKLSGSENHKGFYILSPTNWALADVIPVDEDGIEGGANAEFIVRACNAHEEMLEALRGLLEYPENGTPLHPGSLAWETARAAITKAEGK